MLPLPLMASRLATMLAQELASQRVFLSSDEEASLTRPLSYDDESDLAWDRIRHRRLLFFTALRDRYIRDRRPADAWRALIEAEQAEAGEPTFISNIGVQVLEWSVRTSDRGTMMTTFAARALRWLALLFFALGAYAWFNGAQIPGAIVAGFGAVFFLAGRLFDRYSKRRAAVLVAAARHSKPSPTA